MRYLTFGRQNTAGEQGLSTHSSGFSHSVLPYLFKASHNRV